MNHKPDCFRGAIVLLAFAATITSIAAGAEAVSVAHVEQLYRAVNDPANTGSAVVMSPGVYVLSVNDVAGVARPNGGRIELQQDMSLQGTAGDAAAVVIDGSALPASALTVSFGRTGVVRAGRGSHSIEWLTVRGNADAVAGIAADLAGTPRTWIRVANTICRGSLRGVDLRNVGRAMRSIDAEIVDNEFFGNGAGGSGGVTEGIRNRNEADHGVIRASLSGNRLHDFSVGCLLVNNGSTFGDIQVRSSGDRFEKNQNGCVVVGATADSTTVSYNSATFEARGSAFINNIDPASAASGGIRVFSLSYAGSSNPTGNTATVVLRDCRFSGNQNYDLQVLGARSTAVPPRVPGTDNRAIVELHGSNATIDVAAVDSSPVDPAGTNTVTVARFPTPVISQPPVGQTVSAGQGTTFRVGAAGTGPLSYQWIKDGINVPGATRESLTLSSVQADQVGNYAVVVTNAYGSVTSSLAALTINPEGGTPPGKLMNFSVLATTAPSVPALVMGFVVGGAGGLDRLPVLVRGIGPSLTAFGVNGALGDPVMTLLQGRAVLGSNDDWDSTAPVSGVSAAVRAFPLIAGSRDAVLHHNGLAAGSYTAQIAGKAGAAGVALAELYDATPDASAGTARLVNVSARGQVDRDGQTLIAGLAIGGRGPTHLLIRGLGPALARFGVTGALEDPVLHIYDRAGVLIATNDDWNSDPLLRVSFSAVHAFEPPAGSKDAALLLRLQPGSYTATLSRSSGSGGEGLIEVYELP